MEPTQSCLRECPSPDTLLQFAEGNLADPTRVVQQHIDQCKSCASKVSEISLAGNLLVTLSHETKNDASVNTRSLDATIASEHKRMEQAGPVNLLADRYRLGSFIAAGGMGQVYRATDVVFNREVAVKRLLPKYEGDSGAGQRFREEAALTARLQHPGVPPMHDLGSLPNGDPFLAMKLIAGRTLAELLKERANPAEDLQRFLSIFEQMARAVGYAHAQGVIHRDLKPANVMVGEFGEVQVMDWGLAKKIGAAESPNRLTEELPDDSHQRTVDGTILGTLAYMSPEQARGDVSNIGTATDVFALGAILLEILAGGRVYEGNSRELLSNAQAGNVTAALERLSKSGIDEGLALLTIQCLLPVAKARPSDGVAVANHVASHRALVEERLRESETSRAAAEATATEQAKRRRLFMIGVAMISFVFAIGAGVSTMFAVWAKSEAREAGKQRDRTQAQQKLTMRQLYLAQIAREQSRIDAGGVGVAQAALRAMPEEQRGVEHTWLTRRAEGTPFTFRGHDFAVVTVVFSPDGNTAASGCRRGTIKLWDTQTGAELATLRGHNTYFISLAFNPDGTRLAGASWDKTIQLWDTRTGAELQTLRGHTEAVGSVAFSSEGTRIISSSGDKTIKVWDAKTGSELLTIRAQPGSGGPVAFSPDGTRIASGSGDNSIKIWDFRTGAELATLRGHTCGVADVEFSPDGTLLASAGGDFAIRLWNTQTGAELSRNYRHQHNATSVAFSPDGTRIASASIDKTVKLWSVLSDAELLTLQGHESYVNSVAFSPDGTRLASGSEDNTVKIWDTRIGTELARLKGHESFVMSVAISPDDASIASGCKDGTIKLWDARRRAETATLRGHEQQVNSVVYSPDGKQLASGSSDMTIKLWDALTGTELMTLRGNKDLVSAVAFSPDSERLVSGCYDNRVKLWDARTGEELATLLGHENRINSVAFSPDGTQIASGDGDFMHKGTIKLWDAQTGAELATLRGHKEGVNTVAFSPNGASLASGSAEDVVKLWDVRTGEEQASLRGHDEEVTTVVFSPDGTQLASSSEDKTIRLWDVQTGGELATLRGHENWVTSIKFSSYGTQLVSGSLDKTVILWDARNTTELTTLRSQVSVSSVGFSADGTRIVTDDVAGKQLVWNAATGELMPDEAPPKNRFEGVVSPDGKTSVHVNEKEVVVERRSRHYDAIWSEAHDRRDYWIPILYVDDAAKAEAAGDWWAAEWYLRRLIELKPKLTPEIKRLTKSKFATAEAFEGDLTTRLKHAQKELAKQRAALAPDPALHASLAFNPGRNPFPKASASFTSSFDKVTRAFDGKISYNVAEKTRWTSYGSKNAEDWLAVDFGEPKTFSRIQLAVYEDYGVKPPAEYKIQVWQDDAWKPVELPKFNPAKPTGGEVNEVIFKSVTASKARVVFTPMSNKVGVGVAEMMVSEE